MIRAGVIAEKLRSISWYLSQEQGGDVAEQEEDPYLDTQAVAEQAGVAVATVREYLKRSRRRLAEKQLLRPQDLPEPDRHFQRSPAWRQSTITAWLAAPRRRGRPVSGEPKPEDADPQD